MDNLLMAGPGVEVSYSNNACLITFTLHLHKLTFMTGGVMV